MADKELTQLDASFNAMNNVFLTSGKDVSKKISAIQKIKAKIKSHKYTISRKPEFHEPQAPAPYMRIGAALGIPGKQVELLLNAVLSDPSEDELGTIADLLLVAKLKHASAIEQYDVLRSQAQATFDRELERYQKAVDDDATASLDLSKYDVEGVMGEMRTAWIQMSTSLRDYLVVHDGNIDGLNGNAQKLLRVIDMNSKYLTVTWSRDSMNPSRVEADWDHIINNLKAEHIRTIIQKWTEV